MLANRFVDLQVQLNNKCKGRVCNLLGAPNRIAKTIPNIFPKHFHSGLILGWVGKSFFFLQTTYLHIYAK